MNEKTEEKKSTAFLKGLVAVLIVALVWETWFLFKINREHKQAAEHRKVLQTPVYHPAPFKAARQAASSRADDPWSYDQWDPFAEMDRMQERMNRMFYDSFRRASTSLDPGLSHTGTLHDFFEPDLDIQNKPDRYIITLDIPGMEKDKLNIEMRDHLLTVSGERTSEAEKKDEKSGFYSMERRFGSFSRSIPLPEDADPEQIKASYEKGELTIEILKKSQMPATASSAKKVAIQ